MNVSLTPELEQYVNEQVQRGLFDSANEVIGEGLRLLRKRDEVQQRKWEALRREIAIGIEQADRGQVSAFDQQAVERIKTRGRERLAEERGTRT